MLSRVSEVAEALGAVLTRVVLLLQVNRFHVISRRFLGGQDSAAQATHPATIVHCGEAVIDRLQQQR